MYNFLKNNYAFFNHFFMINNFAVQHFFINSFVEVFIFCANLQSSCFLWHFTIYFFSHITKILFNENNLFLL